MVLKSSSTIRSKSSPQVLTGLYNNWLHLSQDKFILGSFPGVVMRLTFKRKLSYHMLRTYLPSFLFVALAWFSMFIPLEHVPGT